MRDFFANPTVATATTHIQSLLGNEVAVDEQAILAQRQRLPKIVADYIPGDHGRLFSVRYAPREDDQTTSRRHAVLLCNPYGHEYARAYRNLQQFAVQLCQAGFDVMRFDYASTGNSEGNCEHATVERFQDDIFTASQHLRTESACDLLSVVGIRLGASLAATDLRHTADRIVLWDPIFDGGKFLGLLEGLHQTALTSQTRFNRRRQRSSIDQAFGHRMNAEKRASFQELRFPDLPIDTKHLVVFTEGYTQSEIDSEMINSAWNVRQSADSIYWHDQRFTEKCIFIAEHVSIDVGISYRRASMIDQAVVFGTYQNLVGTMTAPGSRYESQRSDELADVAAIFLERGNVASRRTISFACGPSTDDRNPRHQFAAIRSFRDR